MDREFLEKMIGEPEVVEAVWQKWLEQEGKARQALLQARLDHAVEQAVAVAGGRNMKAIRALLDEQAIAGSEDMAAAAKQAVGRLRRENGYLFRSGSVSAPGTGSAAMEELSMEELGRLSMEEYRRYRGRGES